MINKKLKSSKASQLFCNYFRSSAWVNQPPSLWDQKSNSFNFWIRWKYRTINWSYRRMNYDFSQWLASMKNTFSNWSYRRKYRDFIHLLKDFKNISCNDDSWDNRAFPATFFGCRAICRMLRSPCLPEENIECLICIQAQNNARITAKSAANRRWFPITLNAAYRVSAFAPQTMWVNFPHLLK